ncbi:MAG: 3-oxoacyl-ACP reductase FabG [Gammaproteobacteria bacterium]|nr:3-oxoacyl-ACP reductase FabG [Gammaproteobacteria bacterium]
MTDIFDMTGKRVLITGGATGLGLAAANALARYGAEVILAARRIDRIEASVAAIEAKGGCARGIALDVSDSNSISEALEKIQQAGRIDVLINNAGITQDNILMRMKEDEWQQVIDTNLTALYRLSKACLRGMTKARWGRIINVTSVVGSMGNAGQSNYAATKAGAEGMARSLARELGSRSVTVNCIAPGFIDTDMTRALGDDQRGALSAQIPLARLGAPEDVAAAVAFLVSEAAGYITGETVHVNGGLYMA